LNSNHQLPDSKSTNHYTTEVGKKRKTSQRPKKERREGREDIKRKQNTGKDRKQIKGKEIIKRANETEDKEEEAEEGTREGRSPTDVMQRKRR
jgi:hypothetical protein